MPHSQITLVKDNQGKINIKLPSPFRELIWASLLFLLLIFSVLSTSNIKNGIMFAGIEINVPCAFYLTFYVPCPSCGITRAMVAALHLDLDESLRFHWAGIWGIIGWLSLTVWLVLRARLSIRGDLAKFQSFRVLWGRLGVYYAIIFALLTVGNWIHQFISHLSH